MRVLLIEPDILLAKAYTAALERAGMQVQAVSDAQTAVNTADMHRPDVVVLELQLVAHSGVEFLQEFRSYPEWQAIPIILLTLVQPEVLASHPILSAQMGVVDMLYKPNTSLDKLVVAVRNAHRQVAGQ